MGRNRRERKKKEFEKRRASSLGVQTTDLIGDDVQARKALPPGHVGRKKTKERVRKEYESCFAFERAQMEKLFGKKYRKHLRLGESQARKLIEIWDNHFRVRSCRLDLGTKEGAAAFYSKRTIFFPTLDFINLKTLVHEYAHHLHKQMMRQGESLDSATHGEGFIECERRIFEILKETLQEATGDPQC